MSFKTNSGNFYTKKNFQQLVVKRAARCPIWAPGAQFWAPGAQLGTGPPYIQPSRPERKHLYRASRNHEIVYCDFVTLPTSSSSGKRYALTVMCGFSR